MITIEQLIHDPEGVDKQIQKELNAKIVRAVYEWVLDRLFVQLNQE